MRRSFGGGSGGMGGGGGSGGGMLRTLHRAVRAGGVGGGGAGATHEPFSNSTTSSNIIRTKQTCKNTCNTSSNNTIKLSLSSSSSTTSNHSSSPFSSYNNNIPTSAASGTAHSSRPTASSPPPYSACNYDDDSEWEQLDGSEDERGYHQHAYFDDVVFATVPSLDEVQDAMCALQNVFEPTSFSFMKDTVAYDSDKDVGDQVSSPSGYVQTGLAVGPDSDWIEPSVNLCDSKALKPYGVDRVYDAFHMLNSEPSVQRMVISLSSDKAIWNAVLNNEAVREFRESLNQGPADKNFPELSDEEDSDDSAKDIVNWIIVEVKARVTELVDKIMKFVNEVFQPSYETVAGAVDPLEGKLRASFLLSVIVLLVVVVTRANDA